MATYTPNYGLHQWEPSDNFLRTDFNADFQKIDTALGGKVQQQDLEDVRTLIQERCQLIYGEYSGDGTSANHVVFGAYPQVIIIPLGMYTYVSLRNYSNNSLVLTEDGFQVGHSPNSYKSLNEKGESYRYLALLQE